MSDCEFGKLYSEYVIGTPFEKYYHQHPTLNYNPAICCHKDAPFTIFKGVHDNYLCEKAKAAGQCPIEKVK
jgi:hypothetical protein